MNETLERDMANDLNSDTRLGRSFGNTLLSKILIGESIRALPRFSGRVVSISRHSGIDQPHVSKIVQSVIKVKKVKQSELLRLFNGE